MFLEKYLDVFIPSGTLHSASDGPGPPSASKQESDSESIYDLIVATLSKASSAALPDTIQYIEDIAHWAASGRVHAECTVQPGTAEDVGKLLEIFHSRPEVHFAVKGGGHAANPLFSATTGVLIVMTRFNEVIYDAASQTVEIGAGLTWGDVYARLPAGRAVLGGRIPSVGVAGFTLGGGYSWLTNQYGLAVDSVVAFELVKPDGTVVKVTETTDSELFFGLKGGFNNFGIVTKFTLKTFEQGFVWGGSILYFEGKATKVTAAVAEFCENCTDPKASIMAAHVSTLLGIFSQLMFFYDGETPPSGTFDKFLEIAEEFPASIVDVGPHPTFLSLMNGFKVPEVPRMVFETVSVVRFTPTFLQAVLDEIKAVRGAGNLNLITYTAEPFLDSILSHGSNSAFPPDRTTAFALLHIMFTWLGPQNDDKNYEAIKQSTKRLTDLAASSGIETAATATGVKELVKYPNYTIFGTPLEGMYGSNVERLRKLRAKVDPNNVMLRTGGWKF